MKSEFIMKPLSALADIQTGPFGSQLHKDDYVQTGTPIVTVEHLGKKKFTEQNLPCVSDADKERLSKYTLREGDVVFSRVGSVDRCSYVSDEYDGWMFSGRCLRVRPLIEIDSQYLYYYFTLESTKQFVRGIATGATMPSINTKFMGEVPVTYPPIENQRKIASVLSALDDKIELNNKINNNLEQQAQAIFSNEFLTLETLPDSWKQASLIDIADYRNGLAMQKYRPTADETGIPVLKIKELRQGCCDDNSELCSPNIKSEYIIRDGDVIFSWSGSLLVDFWCDGICGLNQHLFKVTSNKYDKWFYYAWTKHHLNRFIAVATDKATTMGHIKRDELSKANVLIPNETDYNRIGTLLQPIYDLIIANRIENKNLAKLRDTLLPKLMSGELDVSNIDL
ncbi:restriction endonuclease subunit S [uncultured Ruminococcus sp.]|uniref:restriction endonuclease subunit S n=1 Tax=uncultured Ruminococcus sp. TaxID=165186 RepID=UPI0025F08948|nr:restriction endonuclease subunit S [uncultured Ruminococcus sp.]